MSRIGPRILAVGKKYVDVVLFPCTAGPSEWREPRPGEGHLSGGGCGCRWLWIVVVVVENIGVGGCY